MPKYVIVKYPELYIDQKAGAYESIAGTYSARELGITRKVYDSKKDAEYDCKRISELNCGVSYGVMELIE